ncbi:unnamed protein product [marine sediment metagenome]|uniref:Uncharacterized protein n=1 Tax=marine sediment metagenome TaxID=412755 RepID=X1B436_9ZZZZ
MKETGKSLFPWAKEVKDLHEAFRTYVWANGERLTIKKPKFLTVSDNGHRLADQNNRSYYVSYGWLYLFWENEDKKKYQFYYQRP